MKRVILAVGLLSLASTAMAAGKNCEELKAEVDAKLQQLRVSSYTLEIIPTEEVKDQKVVGSCDVGRHKLIYRRNNQAQ